MEAVPVLHVTRRRLRALLLVVLLAVLLGTLIGGWFGTRLGGSLPPTTGVRLVSGLTAPVTIERDAHGVPTLVGTNRLDLAFATGFVHGQDRFFQMDLLRRQPAGELAALFGAGLVGEDQRNRVHRFRSRARQRYEQGLQQDRDVLTAYASGVRAGLATLSQPPWEYLLLGVTPTPWTVEDTLLVVLGMYSMLQGDGVERESTRGILAETLPEALAAFLSPTGGPWEAPMLGQPLPGPTIPAPEAIDLRKQPDLWRVHTPPLFALPPRAGSNNWAVAGSRTTHGKAIVANDMHLGLFVPNIWYRARLRWTEEASEHDLVGVTLPGAPALIVGSTRHLAWGFTNIEGDFSDLIVLETDEQRPGHYRTPEGWKALDRHEELIQINGGAAVTMVVEETIWGPVVHRDYRGKPRALAWVAHHPEAVNLGIMQLEKARSLEEALTIATRAGTPGQNFVVADSRGGIAWSPLGRFPVREGFDGRTPTSWADGKHRWAGLLPASAYPRILHPEEGILWTANNRVVGEPWLSRIGTGNFDQGARARQIRDGLRSKTKLDEGDMLNLQLDDRALFLERWQRLLLDVLARTPDNARTELLRREVLAWGGRASVTSVGYRLVRQFRGVVTGIVLGSLTAPCRRSDPQFNPRALDPNVEESVWQLVTVRPAHLLPPDHSSWESLLNSAVVQILQPFPEEPTRFEQALAKYQWGEANRARLSHPLAGALGPLGSWLNMPNEPLPGDTQGMPRIQGPRNGASERLAVSPGREAEGYFHMPTGQSGHPWSPSYRDGHAAWVEGKATPLLPGKAVRVLELRPG